MARRISTPVDLKVLKEMSRELVHLRLDENIELSSDDSFMNILCCAGTGCHAGSSEQIIERFQKLTILKQHRTSANQEW